MIESIHEEFVYADDIIAEYATENEKFAERYQSLLTDINKFISKVGLEEAAHADEMILGYALVDYFEDVSRLKDFHKIDHINSYRIIAYTAYWLLRRKPIQVSRPDKRLVEVNERFVFAYILDSLSNARKNVLLMEHEGLRAFREHLFYCLKYRVRSAADLEMALIAFDAGRIFQDPEADFEGLLAKYRPID